MSEQWTEQATRSADARAPAPGPAGQSHPDAAPSRSHRTGRMQLFLGLAGPGLVVMLADTDVGSVITAAQSGAQWGFRLLWLQALLIPVLYVVQELTVRLGVHTGKGHGELIRDTFGQGWAWISVGGLMIASVGALITEFSGVVGVGQLYGVPPAASLALAVGLLLFVVYTGSYARVERVAIALGLFELAFVAVACYSRPAASHVLAGLTSAPFHDSRYLYLIGANIGAVIMPWMVFYQQSAVTDKQLQPRHLKAARWDTALGAVITQVIMAAVLVAAAVVLGGQQAPIPALDTVGEISHALTPVLGEHLGRTTFALGVLGAAMVAAIVVSLACAWGLGEVTGYRHSLSHQPRQAPWFYVVYTLAVIAGALTVGFADNLVTLSIAVEVLNALLLPLVLGFLLALTFRALPAESRPQGFYAWIVVATIVLISTLGVVSGIAGATGFGG